MPWGAAIAAGSLMAAGTYSGSTVLRGWAILIAVLATLLACAWLGQVVRETARRWVDRTYERGYREGRRDGVLEGRAMAMLTVIDVE